MKKILFLIAIGLFSLSLSNSGMAITNDLVNQHSSDGIVTVMVDDPTETLTVRVAVRNGLERARVMFVNRAGEQIHNEVVMVDTQGTEVYISTAGLRAGNYYLRVQGESFRYAQRIPIH